jgi:leucyl-tRNA synthetase
VYYVNGLPQMIDAVHLPIVYRSREIFTNRRRITTFRNALVWAWDTATNKVVNTDLVDHKTIFPLELNTMPGWAEVRFTGCVIWMRTMKRVCKQRSISLLGKR